MNSMKNTMTVFSDFLTHIAQSGALCFVFTHVDKMIDYDDFYILALNIQLNSNGSQEEPI